MELELKQLIETVIAAASQSSPGRKIRLDWSATDVIVIADAKKTCRVLTSLRQRSSSRSGSFFDRDQHFLYPWIVRAAGEGAQAGRISFNDGYGMTKFVGGYIQKVAHLAFLPLALLLVGKGKSHDAENGKVARGVTAAALEASEKTDAVLIENDRDHGHRI